MKNLTLFLALISLQAFSSNDHLKKGCYKKMLITEDGDFISKRQIVEDPNEVDKKFNRVFKKLTYGKKQRDMGFDILLGAHLSTKDQDELDFSLRNQDLRKSYTVFEDFVKTVNKKLEHSKKYEGSKGDELGDLERISYRELSMKDVAKMVMIEQSREKSNVFCDLSKEKNSLNKFGKLRQRTFMNRALVHADYLVGNVIKPAPCDEIANTKKVNDKSEALKSIQAIMNRAIAKEVSSK